MKIAILGYGMEGRSAEKFLRKQLRNRVSKLEIRDIKRQGKHYLKNLEKFDLIVRSPGVPFLTPEIQQAAKRGVEVTSSTNLFFTALGKKEGAVTVVGITGTKGKGTVAALLYNIFKAAGKKVFLVGNIGKPALDILPKLAAKGGKNTIVVLELSSFQLQDLKFSPHIAVILDISPDHLDYHKSFKEYLEAKSQIVLNPPPNPLPKGGGRRKRDTFFFPDNKFSKLIASKSLPARFAARRAGKAGRGKKFPVSLHSRRSHKLAGLKILGEHNQKNAAMAAAVARELGVREKAIKKATESFRGLPHRLEFVREVKGVKYYNDSASTNPAASAAALTAFPGPKILIAGGKDKGLNFAPLQAALKRHSAKLVILLGENKHKIKRSLLGNRIAKLVKDLKSAVVEAKKAAEPGDVVIFSPGSASFDMFKNSSARGDVFKKLVRKIRG